MFPILIYPAFACIIEPQVNRIARAILFFIDDNGCYICISHRFDRDGYRRLARSYREWLMHRYIWTLFNGEIPAGMEVRHKCHNPACMNIDHLELGTHKQNMEDKKKNPRPDKAPVKLTIEQKKEIARAEGKTIPQLAGEYNVVASTIVKVRRMFGTKKIKRMPDKPSIKIPIIKRKKITNMK
ncbi:MAG: HNH endonuclease signature motif containing protein [Ignavibacteriaceae bacterium]